MKTELALVREANAQRNLRQAKLVVFTQDLLRPLHAARDHIS
jgi:hypothetical protein